MSDGPNQNSSKALSQDKSGFEVHVPGNGQVLSFNGTSAQNGTAFQTKTTLLVLFATTDCFIKRGTNPTAVVNEGQFIAAGIYVPIGIKRGEKIAAIRLTSSGTLYINEAE